MKKISFAIAAICLAALNACSPARVEAPRTDEGLYSYTFNLSHDPDTKVYLAEGDRPTWEDGDIAAIYDAYGHELNMACDVTAGNPPQMTANLYCQLDPGDVLYCYAPYYANAGWYADSLVVNLAPYQDGTIAAMPMAADPLPVTSAIADGASIPTLSFHNLASILEFRVFSENEDICAEYVTNISFKAEDNIAGEAMIDMTAITPDNESSLALSGFDISEVYTCPGEPVAVVSSKSAAVPVHMVIAPGVHSGVITVTTTVATYSFPISSVSFGRNRIKPIALCLTEDKREQTASGYKLVTSLDALESGSYVIAGRTEGTYHALTKNPGSSSGKLASKVVTVTGDVISENEGAEFAYTLTFTDGRVTVANGSEYLVGVSGKSDLEWSKTAKSWNVSYGKAGTFRLSGAVDASRAIAYRLNNSVDFFGHYATQNLTEGSDYHDLELFKLGSAPITPPTTGEVQLQAPVLRSVDASVSYDCIKILWTADPNATAGYWCTVSGGSGSVEPQLVYSDGTKCSLELYGLDPETEYTISVYAVAHEESDGPQTVVYKQSTTSSITLKTTSVPVQGSGDWVLVTDVSQLSEGDEVVFVNRENAVVAGDIDGAIMARVSGVGFSSDGTVITTLPDDAMVMKLGTDGGLWTFASPDGNLLGATAVKKLAWSSGTTKWSISIAANGNSTIQNNTSSYGNLQYNVSSPRFTTYTSTQAPVQIYHRFAEVSGHARLTMSTVSCITRKTDELTFSWNPVGKASAYVVRFDGGDPQETTATTYTAKNLQEGTGYTITVYAVSADEHFDDSDPKSCTAYTLKSGGGATGEACRGWFELPAQKDDDHNGIDDLNMDYYYSWTMRADAPAIRNFSCCYSKSMMHPVWVAAPMHSSYKGGSGRNDSYRADPNIRCAQSSSYSGYTRGHMVGSSDRTVSVATNKQAFYYSNIGAQLSSGFNTGGGAWNNLEEFVDGQWCSDTLYQVIGCIFETFTDQYGSTITKKTGTNGGGSAFQVPTAYYKVLLRTKKGNTGKRVDQCSPDELKCVAFILSHKANQSHKPCAKDMYTVEEVERLTGLTFFVNVPDAPKGTFSASDWGL